MPDASHAAVMEASALIGLERAPRVRAELLRLFQKSRLVKGTPFAGNIGKQWAEWEKRTAKALIDRLEKTLRLPPPKPASPRRKR